MCSVVDTSWPENHFYIRLILYRVSRIDIFSKKDKTMKNVNACCLYCQKTSDEVPLISLQFKNHDLKICPQHLPILIHDPARLIGKLPGAEGLEPADHHD